MNLRRALATLVFGVCPLVAIAQTPTASGVWLGTLAAGPQTLRIQFHLQPDTTGPGACVLDSIDQGAFGIPCQLTATGTHIDIKVPAVSGSWTGTLFTDGQTLKGTWTQGAGSIRSTAADMLTYLEAQLHPDKLLPSGIGTPQGKTLPAALAASHIVHAEVAPGTHIALNWFVIDASKTYWHNGATGGYSSIALFNPEQDFAIIVLSNTSPGPGSITDQLGYHIAARLTGQPAPSLAPQSH